MPEPDPDGPADRDVADGIGVRVTELVNATIDLGAQLTRSVAQVTTRDPLPPPGGRPLEDIVTYGAAAAGNVLSLLSGASRLVPGRSPNPAAPATSDGPVITAGSTLRVPLLVENTGAVPTVELAFEATDVTRTGPSGDVTGTAIEVSAVSFSPPTLVVAPRDFEKLTVRIATAADAVPGRYRATIAGGDGWFSTVIDFGVNARG